LAVSSSRSSWERASRTWGMPDSRLIVRMEGKAVFGRGRMGLGCLILRDLSSKPASREVLDRDGDDVEGSLSGFARRNLCASDAGGEFE
jgi:hypothetical protein